MQQLKAVYVVSCFVCRTTNIHVGLIKMFRKILRKPRTTRQEEVQKQADVFACRYIIHDVQACSNQIIFLLASHTKRGTVYLLLSLQSSRSWLSFPNYLSVTSTLPSIFPSTTCSRRQFLRNMWPIQLVFLLSLYVGYSSTPSPWVIKFSLEQATKAQSGSRCIALPLLQHQRYRWGWVVNATPRPLYLWERAGTHCIGGWVGLRVGLDGCGKCCLHRVTLGNTS